jgi:uroporphyrinogen decarboxylase
VNSRERLLTALRCEEPDRVPFLESYVEEPAALALLGRAGNEPKPDDGLGGGPVHIGMRPPSGGGYSAIEIVQSLGLDAIGVSFYLPNLGVKKEIAGRKMLVGGDISSANDVARIQLPDPDAPALYEPLQRFIERYRGTQLALFCRLPLGSDPVVLGMGFENFAYALHDDPRLVESLFDLYAGWYAKAMKHLCQMDFDFIWSGEDIAYKSGPYVSPEMFRRVFMPHYRHVADQITKPWIFHSDGNLMPILDDLLSLGLSGLHPIEPGPMDLAHLKRHYGESLCLCGNISVDTLSQGRPEDIERLVKDAIAIAGPGGGYIAGSSNSITSYCAPENVRAMQKAILTYGRYPLSSTFSPETPGRVDLQENE